MAIAPLILLLFAVGCNKAAEQTDAVMVELRVIMLEENDPENQPASDANRALTIIGALSYNELRGLAESTNDQEVLRKLEVHKNFNIMIAVRKIHTANNSQVLSILQTLADLPMGKEGSPTEPMAARVIMMALQALG